MKETKKEIQKRKIKLAKYRVRKNLTTNNESEKETLPISDFYEVLDYQTIKKSHFWWSAIVLFKVKNRTSIGLYLWQKKDGKWKRKNKFTINNKEDYQLINEIVTGFINQLK